MIQEQLDESYTEALWIRHDCLVDEIKDAVEELTRIKEKLGVGRFV